MEKSIEKKPLDLKRIKQVPLKEGQYVKEVTTKKQIVLHHTAGSSSANNVISGWNNTNERIGTCVVISGKGAAYSYDGEIVQCFSSKHWAYHLGVKEATFKDFGLSYVNLDKLSIGVEICNWGQLTRGSDGKFYNHLKKVVDSDEVTTLVTPYKGHQYFHKYTDAQIESVRQLLVYWSELYNISLKYDYDQLFTQNKKALKGENGLFTHNSYRKDKIDAYPCPRLIEMLKSL